MLWIRSWAAPSNPRRSKAYAAWCWVVIFDALHVHWYTGGTFGHPGALPPLSFDLYGTVVLALVVVGTVVPLLAAHHSGRVVPDSLVVAALWIGAAILLLRGGAGVADELLRVTGTAPLGLTGLTREQVTGFADPSQVVLWTGRATDAFFVLGGVVFGRAARTRPG